MRFDAFSLAAAIRDAGIAEGEAALNLATNLMLRLRTPTADMVANEAIDRAASQSALDICVANLRAEPCRA